VLSAESFSSPEGVMREQRTTVNFSKVGAFQVLEMRRRIADCRDRLRRKRAARRIPARATPPTELFAPAEVPETALASANMCDAEDEI
jgi:hypothetical protein